MMRSGGRLRTGGSRGMRQVPGVTRPADYLVLIATAALAGGCAHRTAAAPAPPVIQATPVVITPHEDEAPEAMFRRAELLLAEGKGAEAGPLFDRLAALDPAGPIAPA